MDWLSIPFLFFASGLFFATVVAFLDGMLFGEFEGIGSAFSLAGFGSVAFVFALYLTDLVQFDSFGFLFAVILAFVCWSISFQVMYEFAVLRALLYGLMITLLSLLVAFGLPEVLTRAGVV